MSDTIELDLVFKKGVDPDSVDKLHPGLWRPVQMLMFNIHRLGYMGIITSTIRPKTTDSGVHATGRAIDIGVRKLDGSRVVFNKYLISVFRKLAYIINVAYPRPDKKFTVWFHNSGLGWHFHIQMPWDKNFKDLNATLK